jgi:hypothetical protein
MVPSSVICFHARARGAGRCATATSSSTNLSPPSSASYTSEEGRDMWPGVRMQKRCSMLHQYLTVLFIGVEAGRLRYEVL